MRQLRKKEIKELNQKIKQTYNIDDFFDKKDKVSMDENVILKDKDAVFFYHEEQLIPTLKLLLKNNFLPKVTVDMGAVKFVVSGADVMRPGITNVEEFKAKEAVCVIDESHKKALAVAMPLLDSVELMKQTKGKSLNSLHYIGDNIYLI